MRVNRDLDARTCLLDQTTPHPSRREFSKCTERRSGSTRCELTPMECQVGNQDSQEGDDNDLHSKARLAMAVPSRDRLQNASANKGERNGVRAHHPFAMLLDMPIARGEVGGSCSDDPSSSLNDVSGHPMDGTWIVAMVGQDYREGSGDHDRNHIDPAERTMKRRITLAEPAGEL